MPSQLHRTSACVRERSSSTITQVASSPRPMTSADSGGASSRRAPMTGPRSTSSVAPLPSPSMARTSSRARLSVRCGGVGVASAGAGVTRTRYAPSSNIVPLPIAPVSPVLRRALSITTSATARHVPCSMRTWTSRTTVEGNRIRALAPLPIVTISSATSTAGSAG